MSDRSKYRGPDIVLKKRQAVGHGECQGCGHLVNGRPPPHNVETRTRIDDGSGRGLPDGGVDINDLLFFLVHFEAGC